MPTSLSVKRTTGRSLAPRIPSGHTTPTGDTSPRGVHDTGSFPAPRIRNKSRGIWSRSSMGVARQWWVARAAASDCHARAAVGRDPTAPPQRRRLARPARPSAGRHVAGHPASTPPLRLRPRSRRSPSSFAHSLTRYLHTMLGLRDRALLLIGFAGAFRRSELVGIDYEDLRRSCRRHHHFPRHGDGRPRPSHSRGGRPLGRIAKPVPSGHSRTGSRRHPS